MLLTQKGWGSRCWEGERGGYSGFLGENSRSKRKSSPPKYFGTNTPMVVSGQWLVVSGHESFVSGQLMSTEPLTTD